MVYLYITKDKEVITGTIKSIKNKFNIKKEFSWSKMHQLRSEEKLSIKEKEFFESINIIPTIFNVSNLREYGLFQVYKLTLMLSSLKNNEIIKIN